MDRNPPSQSPPKPRASTKAEADEYAGRLWREYTETALTRDQRLYYDAEQLYAQLVDRPDGGPAPVRLLRGSRLPARARRLRKCTTDLERERWRLPRRQELPELDVLTEQEVRALPRGHVGQAWETCCPSEQTRADQPLRIIAMTHGWLTPEHPDPFGEQLVRFADLVEHERQWCPGGCVDVCRYATTFGLSAGCCFFIVPCAGQRCGDVADQFPSGEFAVFYECARAQ